MVERLLNLALIGGEPILYILIVLSFLSIAVVLERMTFYTRNKVDLANLSSKLVEHLNKGETNEAMTFLETLHGAEIEVMKVGLENYAKGSTVVNELMESVALEQQRNLDKRLTFIGTIGSNAPFVGLLGTVLGIIKAFNDLSMASAGGPSVVMAGIAEALVATAVGLFVAIPAVVFYNYFKTRQKNIMSNIAQLERLILAFIDENTSTTSHVDTSSKNVSR